MTFWAKLLTIIAFVLGLIFATMSGVLYVKRADLHETNKNLQKEMTTKVKELENKNNDAQAAIDRLKADLAMKTTEANDLTNRLDTAIGERKVFEVELAKQQDLVKRLSLNLSDQQRAFADPAQARARGHSLVWQRSTQIGRVEPDASNLSSHRPKSIPFQQARSHATKAGQLSVGSHVLCIVPAIRSTPDGGHDRGIEGDGDGYAARQRLTHMGRQPRQVGIADE